MWCHEHGAISSPEKFDWGCYANRVLLEEQYGAASLQQPLLNRRMDAVMSEAGEEVESLPILERLLRCQALDGHAEIAAVLWDSASDQDARVQLEALADQKLLEWEQMGSDGEVETAQG